MLSRIDPVVCYAFDRFDRLMSTFVILAFYVHVFFPSLQLFMIIEEPINTTYNIRWDNASYQP